MIENRVTFVTFLLGFDLSQKRINTNAVWERVELGWPGCSEVRSNSTMDSSWSWNRVRNWSVASARRPVQVEGVLYYPANLKCGKVTGKSCLRDWANETAGIKTGKEQRDPRAAPRLITLLP
jgi:hypothetical protein